MIIGRLPGSQLSGRRRRRPAPRPPSGRRARSRGPRARGARLVSPVPWIEKNTGMSGSSRFQAVTTPSAITSVRRERSAEVDDEAFDAGLDRPASARPPTWCRPRRRSRGSSPGAAAMADDVHGRHRQPGAVGQHADIAVELDELEPVGGALPLQIGHRLVRRRAGQLAWRKAAESSSVSLQSRATTRPSASPRAG